jgi:hypothetical protein
MGRRVKFISRHFTGIRMKGQKEDIETGTSRQVRCVSTYTSDVSYVTLRLIRYQLYDTRPGLFEHSLS